MILILAQRNCACLKQPDSDWIAEVIQATQLNQNSFLGKAALKGTYAQLI